jgi:hypothetical protein
LESVAATRGILHCHRSRLGGCYGCFYAPDPGLAPLPEFGRVEVGMADLAAAAFQLYELFRPAFPGGAKGSGAAGELTFWRRSKDLPDQSSGDY